MLPSLSARIILASLAYKAYFNLCCNMTESGIDSLNLCGPYDGLVVQLPPNLESIQDLGAVILFICFFGPLAFNIRSC